MRFPLNSIVVAIWLLIGCDSQMADLSHEKLISSRPIRACEPSKFQEDEFALRIVNKSSFKIDSMRVQLQPPLGEASSTLRFEFGFHPISSSSCYQALPLTFYSEQLGFVRSYDYVSFIARDLDLGFVYPNKHIPITFGPGQYTYRFDLLEDLSPEIRGTEVRYDSAGATRLLKLVNVSDSGFKDISVNGQYVGDLASGDSTGYFDAGSFGWDLAISLIAGQDSLLSYPSDDLGFPPMPVGYYSARIDTVHRIHYTNISELAKEN